MTKIIVAGGQGRMGKEVIKAIVDTEGVTLSAVKILKDSQDMGVDAGVVAGLDQTLGVKMSSSFENSDFDVLIDFTTPKATLSHLQFCLSNRKKIVIGTTGFTTEEKAMVHQAAQDIAVVFSPNMSVGVNVAFALLKEAAKLLKDADVEIIEAHHRLKKDAPSGTALKMGEIIAEVLDRDLTENALYGRQGNMGVREKNTIGFSTIRAGDIVGEHTVLFGLAGERLEISHKATSRQAFARGAVRAAQWLVSQKPGLYSMEDVLFQRFAS